MTIFFVSLAWSVAAFASSYKTPIAFAHELTGITRYFDGQNITFEATPITYPDRHYPDAKPVYSI